jgi:acetyl esterase
MMKTAWFNARVAMARSRIPMSGLLYAGRRLHKDGLVLDATAQLVCDTVNSLRTKTIWETSPELAREQFERVIDLYGESPLAVANVEDRTIPGPDGHMTVRLYTPTQSETPLPIFVYYHGGGFVQGSLRAYDSTCRHLAVASNAIVVVPDYRLAPEGKFPAAVNDCLAATIWVAENAETFGGDANRIAVGGDSAGGNLTAIITQECRDAGGPDITYQVLIYPMLDWSCRTKSFELFGSSGLFLTRERIDWYAQHLFTDSSESETVRASPGKAKSLAGLPPALVITAGFDPLRDEGRQYAKRLKEASVLVDLVEYEGMVHGFAFMASAFPQGIKLLNQIGRASRDAFSR